MVLNNRTTPPDWTDDAGGGERGARCRVFIVSRDADGAVRNDAWFQEADQALPVCNGDYIGTPCPMRNDCLLAALINNDRHGVFGGLTAPQRMWVRRNIPKDSWDDFDRIRDEVPPVEYFKNLGDSDPEEDAFA